MPEVTHGTLALPGYWRLAGFGKLDRIPSTHSSPRIKTYLRPLPEWPKSVMATGIATQAARHIHIGELALLHLNTVLLDGKVLPIPINPWVKRVRLPFDMTRDNLTVFRRFEHDDRGDAIIPVRNINLQADPDANALFVGIGNKKDPFAYVVPCVENFRFFYTTSSALSKSMLSGDFLDPNRHLWDVDDSWINRPQRRAFMQLRKRMLDEDARFLARFAFDEYALKQAREVFLYAAGQTAERGERTIRALPPFQGRTDFVANVVEFESAGRRRLLVTQFISCHWKPPFDDIEFLRDNDGRFDPNNRDQREKSKYGDIPRPEPRDPPNEVNLGEGPARVDLAPWRLRGTQIDERFPELSKVRATKRERKDATTASSPRSGAHAEESPGEGTVGAVKTSANEVAGVLISGLGQVVLPREEIATDVAVQAGDAIYQLTIELLLMIRSCRLASVEFIRVTEQVVYLESIVLNVFPDDLSVEKRSWLYVDTDKNCRRVAVIASVAKEGRVRYLIDIQHKRPNECSMLVVWGDAEAELDAGFLGQALFACQKAEGASLKALNHLPIHWARLRHSAKQKGEAEAESLMRRIIDVRPIS